MSSSKSPGKEISFNFKQRENPRPGDIYSFILRVRFDPSPGGKGTARPMFHLENVGAGEDKRLTRFDEVIKVLSAWIEAVHDNTASTGSGNR